MNEENFEGRLLTGKEPGAGTVNDLCKGREGEKGKVHSVLKSSSHVGA